MDPNATLQAFLTAINENDALGAQESADNLAAWLGRGGFEPNWLPEEREAFFLFLTVEPYDVN